MSDKSHDAEVRTNSVEPAGDKSVHAGRRPRAPSQPPRGPARFSDAVSGTSANLLYQDLREAIVTMRLRPGDPISESRVAAENGVSRTPVREAVLRLAKEKLVEIVPKSGTFVGRIPISSLIEAIVARRALEVVNVRRAVELATPSRVLEFRAILERQREIAATGDLEQFHRADEEFHAAFAHVAGYSGIWELIRQIKLQVDRYRQLTLPLAGRVDLIVAEHKAVVDAVEQGDPDAAGQAMEAHLDKLQLDIQILHEMWPDYFIHDRKVNEQD